MGTAVERDVVGIKIENEGIPASVSRKNSMPKDLKPPTLHHQPSTSGSTFGSGGKTVWLDTLDSGGRVNVEAMCLSHYRRVLGYKGYHSEGGVLRTIFGLLFFDILFHDPYIPNVFQTAYQTCPLDLHTDSFFSSRMPEILARINQISNGEAVDIVTRVWDAHFDRRTCIVGVRWDGFERDDLLELVACWDGPALGTVMLVMAQEYQSRGGGVPDLILWKTDEKEEEGGGDGKDPKGRPTPPAPGRTGAGEVLFVEVKSANDRLSDTQRLWISVLLSAGVPVELCHAVAGEVRPSA
jgi:Fanconi-associated nuclease 1